MAKMKIKDMPIGARVCNPGSSEAILTGDWRSYTPWSTRKSASTA